MNIPQTYDYLVRARRDLWTTLESVPDEVLSRPLIGGPRFQCIKDLVFHIAGVEDGWLHYTILQDEPVQQTFPVVKDIQDGPFCAQVPLGTLLAYWRAVEESTLAYLAGLTDDDLKRLVNDSPTERFLLDSLLQHVMIHEMRHTAQIALLLRMQGVRPPALDLLFYLPSIP
ncbi:DinB family protein [Deinococcus sp.]|uniref:DinB family protein n=1 Tax=Deinococcus sp. TaxID=47478 RepID=UPI003CC66866